MKLLGEPAGCQPGAGSAQKSGLFPGFVGWGVHEPTMREHPASAPAVGCPGQPFAWINEPQTWAKTHVLAQTFRPGQLALLFLYFWIVVELCLLDTSCFLVEQVVFLGFSHIHLKVRGENNMREFTFTVSFAFEVIQLECQRCSLPSRGQLYGSTRLIS